MGVVNVNSTQITNDVATPAVFNNSYLSGSFAKEAVDVCTMGAADSNNSTYRFCRIPSNARITDIEVMNDANTSGTSYKAGVLLVNGGSTVVTGSDAIFIPAGTSMASARATWTSLYFPAVAGASAAAANLTKRVWELLGLTADPIATYDVVVTAVTAGSAGGSLALKVSWTV
jgi:hypothetical protein